MRAAVVLAVATLVATPAAAQPANLADMDRDRDGGVSRGEYRTALVDSSMRYDKDRDGRVTLGELPGFARLPGAKGIVQRIFKAGDADGDGALSRAELAARAEVRFSQLDITGDGVLDGAEIKASRRRR